MSIGNNILDNTYRSAIYLLGSADRVIMSSNLIKNANTSANTSHAGILASSCDDLIITGNAIIGSANGAKQGINLEGVYSRALVTNNELTDCQGMASIYAETVTSGLFANNIIDGMASRGILVSGANVSITGNNFAGTFSNTPLQTPNVTNAIIRDNVGYSTEAAGTATVAPDTTSITVNHGLAKTPALKDITVTPTNNLGSATKLWVRASLGISSPGRMAGGYRRTICPAWDAE